VGRALLMRWSSGSGPADNLTNVGNVLQARGVFILFWMALWLYLSLGMALLSFSAIQFQSNVTTGLRVDEAAIRGVTVAGIKLHRESYKDQIAEARRIKQQLLQLSSENYTTTRPAETAKG